MRTRANIFTLTGHQSTVADVKTQESDPQIISGSMDSTVRSATCHASSGVELTVVGSGI